VEAHVLFDAPEGGGGVVRVADEEAPRLVGEPPEAALGVEVEQVLVALEAGGS